MYAIRSYYVPPLKGWVLDLLAARDGMEVWFRTAAGDTVTLFAPFRPAFAVTGRSVRETASYNFV